MAWYSKLLKFALPISTVAGATFFTCNLIISKKISKDIESNIDKQKLTNFVTLDEHFKEEIINKSENGIKEKVSTEEVKKAEKAIESLKNKKLSVDSPFKTREDAVKFLNEFPKKKLNELLRKSKLSADELSEFKLEKIINEDNSKKDLALEEAIGSSNLNIDNSGSELTQVDSDINKRNLENEKEFDSNKENQNSAFPIPEKNFSELNEQFVRKQESNSSDLNFENSQDRNDLSKPKDVEEEVLNQMDAQELQDDSLLQVSESENHEKEANDFSSLEDSSYSKIEIEKQIYPKLSLETEMKFQENFDLNTQEKQVPELELPEISKDMKFDNNESSFNIELLSKLAKKIVLTEEKLENLINKP